MTKNTLECVVETVNAFLDEECGDGDVCILLGNKTNAAVDNLNFLKEKFIQTRQYMRIAYEIPNEEYIISDMKNENIVLTTSSVTYNQQPTWVMFKMELF